VSQVPYNAPDQTLRYLASFRRRAMAGEDLLEIRDRRKDLLVFVVDCHTT
jgi:hypothetical protein